MESHFFNNCRALIKTHDGNEDVAFLIKSECLAQQDVVCRAFETKTLNLKLESNSVHL